MKYLKSLLFVFIIFITFGVSAQEVDITSSCRSPISSTNSTYGGLLNSLQSGNVSTFNFNKTYNGRLSFISFDVYRSFSANTTYTISLYMNDSDFRNTISEVKVYDVSNNDNILISSSRFVSMRKIQIDFTTTSSSSHLYFFIGGGGSNYITGVNTWNLKNIMLDTSSESNGTNEIIDNNNSNTQDIINNANLNSLREYNQIRNQKSNTCSNFIQFDYSMGYHLKWNGVVVEASDEYYTSDYVPFNSTDLKYSITGSNSSNIDEYICFYDSSKNLLGGDCTYLRDRNSTAPSGSKYFRLSTKKYTTDVFYGYDGCSNRTDEINSYLKDNSDPNISDNEFLSVFNNIGFTDPLQHLLQLPVQFINALVSQSNTCQTINLGTLWGVSLTLPCINLENIIGSNVWGIIDILMSIGLLVVIIKNLYQTFANLMTMGGEKEAREKFSMPTPMEFLSMILGGDK